MNHYDLTSIVRKVDSLSDCGVLEELIERQIDIPPKIIHKLKTILKEAMLND